MAERLTHVILRNTAWNYVATFLSLGLGLLFVPILIRSLGDTRYGLWVLVNALVGYAGLLDLGLGTAALKWVSEYRAQDAQDKMNEFMSTLCSLYLGLAVLVILVTLVIAILFDRLFTVTPDEVEVARAVLMVIGAAVALSLPVSLSGTVLAAYQRYDILNWLSIANLVLGMGSIVVLLWAGYGLLAVAFAHVGAMFIAHALRIWAACRVNPRLSIQLRRFSRAHVRMVRSYAALVAIQNGMRLLVLRTDEIVIGAFLPLSLITQYSVGMKLSNAVRVLGEQMVATLFPVAAHLHGERDAKRLGQLVIDGTRLALGLGLPPTIAMLVLARPLINVWIGEGYDQAATVTVVLLLHTVGMMIAWVPLTVAQAIGVVRVLTIMVVIEGILNVLLSVALIGSFGILGVALGTSIPGVISTVLVQTTYACRMLQISLERFVREALGPPLVVAVAVYAGLYFFTQVVRPESTLEVAATAALGMGTYWTIFVVWCVPRKIAVEGLRLLLAQVRWRS